METCNTRGSRYFHSIYNPQDEVFIHADGAIRFYTQDELSGRKTTHVRRAGKTGKRVKVFQLDGVIERDAWTTLACAFFVWNEDVMSYFGCGVA